MRYVLKFCYLSLCLLVMSCAGNDAKKADQKEKIPSVDTSPQSKKTQKTILFFGNSSPPQRNTLRCHK